MISVTSGDRQVQRASRGRQAPQAQTARTERPAPQGRPGPKGDSFQTVVEDDGNGNITIRALTTEGTGTSGQNGYTFTPSVSAEGVISWTNDGDLENPTPVNIKGPAGATGATGAPGAKGADGKTPVKGTDYFTAADKAELVQAVLTALPDGDGATYG